MGGALARLDIALRLPVVHHPVLTSAVVTAAAVVPLLAQLTPGFVHIIVYVLLTYWEGEEVASDHQ